MNALESIAPKLAKMIPLLGSDKIGEVASCAAAIGRLLIGVGANWHDLAALSGITEHPSQKQTRGQEQPKKTRVKKQPTQAHQTSDTEEAAHLHKRMIAAILSDVHALSSWDRKFVESLQRLTASRNVLSETQAALLTKIYADRD